MPGLMGLQACQVVQVEVVKKWNLYIMAYHIQAPLERALPFRVV